MPFNYFKFKALYQKGSWISPAFAGVDGFGIIRYLSKDAPADGVAVEVIDGMAIPGFQNGHSHAFQYAMAGLAENHPAGTRDDFWSWREEMYKCALSVDPDQIEAIATQLYSEMLRHGYTHVAEFHYLHHDKAGKPYSNIAEMGERILLAAKTAGIRITLVPVFYQKGNFGQDPQPRQMRFISKTVDEYFNLLDSSRKLLAKYMDARLGYSVHSLRAVDPKDVIVTYAQGPREAPFHLHISEQKKEVSDCLAFCGKRPVQWLLDNLEVNNNFFLVHATHLDDQELNGLAKSGATVVLCPSTEGNLGDGIFRMKEYAKLGGKWCIGTDSHIGINPLGEFRMIDYRQRLVSNQRNTFDGDAGAYMVNEEVESGRRAVGVEGGNHFEIGHPLDAVVYDASSPLIGNTSLPGLLATIVFASDSHHQLGTLVGGKWVVKKGRHFREETIHSGFSMAIKQLKNR